jgi:hypothetical protein
VDDVSLVAVCWFMDGQDTSEEITSWSGSRTFRFTFDQSDVDFNKMAGAIVLSVSGGILCENGSSDAASISISQPYIRQGSN